MPETLKPVNHRLRQETALFGFEAYLTLPELENVWERALWGLKDMSDQSYGEIDAPELVNVIARETGLRPPARGSKLRDFVMERAQSVADYEGEKMRERSEAMRGLLYSYVDDFFKDPDGTFERIIVEFACVGIELSDDEIDATLEQLHDFVAMQYPDEEIDV